LSARERSDDNSAVQVLSAINRTELRRYVERVGDRWPIQVALLGGARLEDELGAFPQRERGPEYIVVLVSDAYEGIPWLERVYLAGSLWDGYEMGDRADLHCYTAAEFERRRQTMPAVNRVIANGLDLLALD
jgi:hypothetical protein